jgi:oligopeptide/dipeptide ABC transporter ATP-binding protein
MSALLEIERLAVELPVGRRSRRVIHDVSLAIAPGESVGMVGESGSGKSMTARAIVRLLPRGARVDGDIRFEGTSVLARDRARMRQLRAHGIAMIHQDPRAALNPLRTVGDFLVEAPMRTAGSSLHEAQDRAVELLRAVGIPDAPRRLRQYPHQLSGGLLQRVMIAAALMAEPKLLLADEPTTALDVTTQEEVMAILDEQRRQRGLGMLFITHDLDLAAAVTDRIAVVYAGVVVETAASQRLHDTARHPYTAGLLAARPSPTRVERLVTIPGRPVSAFEAGPGCVFASRCPFAEDRCLATRPGPRDVGGHPVACHRAEEIAAQLPVHRTVSA